MMRKKEIVMVAALVAMMSALTGATEPVALKVERVVTPAFTPLKFGDIKPQGWILAQMKRDLATGFAGHLDVLCKEASSDIFVSGRNQPGKSNNGNAWGSAWWNGETEGNWRGGYIMQACLTEDPEAMKKAKAYVEHILASQDKDGYMGIFSPELRYRGNGEFWTQTCLFRGLLAYADATGDDRVFTAVRRAVDRTIEGYGNKPINTGSQHDVMYTDVLRFLHDRTGDQKYIEFGLRILRDNQKLRNYFDKPVVNGKTNPGFHEGHGATIMEALRIPFWLWQATGDESHLRTGESALTALKPFIFPSGALVSQESVNRMPNPWNVGYEYCTMFEREFTLITAGQIAGKATEFQDAEHLFVNAIQGSRQPDGSAVLYCSYENRLSVRDEIHARQRFSPTHKQAAVCCNPNATRVAPYFVANSWMKPGGVEPALAAVLYGPCEVNAQIGGVPVRIEEKTNYPYSGNVEFVMHPAKAVSFCLWLRNPAWSRNTKIVCSGAEIERKDDFWLVRKEWKAGDTVIVCFDQAVREVPAINGEVALQYGPLLYVLPINGDKNTIKTYPNSDLTDYYVTQLKGVTAYEIRELFLPSDKRASGFGFAPRDVGGARSDYPLDNPPVVLEGSLHRRDGSMMSATLVPMGAKSTMLRRVTFWIGNPPPLFAGGYEAENATMLGKVRTYKDTAASGGVGVGAIGTVGDGIECRSPLLTGRQLKIRYAARNATTMTLDVNEATQQVAFPSTGYWTGEGAYAEVTVSVVIPENAVIKLRRAPGDGAVNLDGLKGIASEKGVE